MKPTKFIVERTNTGYSAYAEDLPVATTGETMAALKANALEAVTLYHQELNRRVAATEIQLVLDLPQFFEFYNVINASALSKRLGINQSLLAQYISGAKKPSAKQVQRILQGIRDVGQELAEIEIAA